ncbi:MAG: phosphate ABC transporter permease PstA [Planctomycetes bacterium]|nr:phosphate ABC transporter permease PstA [Planctomycetota bacterium]
MTSTQTKPGAAHNDPTAGPRAGVAIKPPAPSYNRSRSRNKTSLYAHGEPMVWLTGGALAMCLLMIIGLVALIVAQGVATFWPGPVVRYQTLDGVRAGETTRLENYSPEDSVFERLPESSRAAARKMVADNGGVTGRRLVRIGNYEITGEHFAWVSDFEIAPGADAVSTPPWMLVVERLAWGRFYGEPVGVVIEGKLIPCEPAEAWKLFGEHHPAVRERWEQRRRLETGDIGVINHRAEQARLALRAVEMKYGKESPQWRAEHESFLKTEERDKAEFDRIAREIEALNNTNNGYKIVLRTADGTESTLGMADIVRAYPANQLSFAQKSVVYLSRWWEFLTDDPREANSEGGVYPAIFGTVVMTLIMSLLVVPFGVLAALYLREYAKGGILISAVRIAINNLAGVPSIVFGVFGLGFFCYIIGGGIDQLFFSAKLPSPTFGTGGLMWASFTLALLTLPVVIVATEETLAAVPGSMREGSYACGASKWQTIKRIVLPRAMPGIMTGMILAMARGAGEVAPLMLVGAVKLAPELPVNGVFPFFHPERSFMHLGFHIYDLGFQSPNAEAAKPMVFTTTLLLILIIAVLNLAAVFIRARLRRRFSSSQF